jgi:LysM repeat protein
MEAQNKNLKSIFFNFLLLLAFIFSVMALYISLSFSEKIVTEEKGTLEEELSQELEQLNQSITSLEQKVLDQADSMKVMKEQLAQHEQKATTTQLKLANNEVIKAEKVSQDSTRYHVIQSGDTFSKVAKIYGVPLTTLMNANKELNPKALRVGEKIVIP